MTSIGEASADVSCCHKSLTSPADVLFSKANLSFIKHVVFFFPILKEQISVRMGFRDNHLPWDKAFGTFGENFFHTNKTESGQIVKILLQSSDSVPNNKILAC